MGPTAAFMYSVSDGSTNLRHHMETEFADRAVDLRIVLPGKRTTSFAYDRGGLDLEDVTELK